MSLFLDNPVQPILKVPAEAAVWSHCAPLLASVEPAARWQIYLHQLGWAALLPWFQSEFEVTPQLCPEGHPWGLWQVVAGIVLTLETGLASGGENRRIVVMLSEALDASELRVPQEWVDIAPWAGDYFVAAQIDVDEQQVALWGYVTRSQLKAEGTYDAEDRAYYLNEASLIQDFSAFWVAQRMPQPVSQSVSQQVSQQVSQAVSQAVPQVAATSTVVPSVQADNLLTRLVPVPEPRLEIPFSLWSALIRDEQWRQRFYQHRQGVTLPNWPIDSSVTPPATLPVNLPINLSNWVLPSSRQLASQVVEAGWRVLDAFTTQAPAASFRGETPPQPDATQAGVTCGKRLTLQTASDTFSLVLAISVAAESDQRRNIRIQLYPAGPSVPAASLTESSPPTGNVASEETVLGEGVFSPDAFSESVFSPNLLLPKDLTLSLHIADATEPLRTIQAGDHDNYIQLPPFSCPTGRSFMVRIQQADGVITTDFVS
ncbi:MAG: DUF1822 family protein [Cyanobacteria bacterium J06649_4]